MGGSRTLNEMDGWSIFNSAGNANGRDIPYTLGVAACALTQAPQAKDIS